MSLAWALASVPGADLSGRKSIKLGKEAIAQRVFPAGDKDTIE